MQQSRLPREDTCYERAAATPCPIQAPSQPSSSPDQAVHLQAMFMHCSGPVYALIKRCVVEICHCREFVITPENWGNQLQVTSRRIQPSPLAKRALHPLSYAASTCGSSHSNGGNIEIMTIASLHWNKVAHSTQSNKFNASKGGLTPFPHHPNCLYLLAGMA